MTHTQGERAQTALAHELFAAAQLAPGEGIEDAVSRIAAALTSALSVSDGLRTLRDATLKGLSHAELLEKAHYLMELNSNQARTIGELQDLVEAAPAQPAAPQGVAYALPDFDTVEQHIYGACRRHITQDMLEPIHNLIREAVDADRAHHGQAPAGAAREPTAFIHWPIDGPPRLVWYSQKALNDAILKTYEGHRPDVKLYTAQAAPAAADFTTLGAALRAIQQAIDLIGEPADDRMRTVKRVLRGAVIVAEDSGELSAPAAGAVAGMPPGISALMCVISSLRDTAHFSDEEGELTDELRTLRDWAMTQAAAPTPAAPAADSVLEDAARLLRQILAASQDGDSDTHLSAHFVSRIETITKPGGAA